MKDLINIIIMIKMKKKKNYLQRGLCQPLQHKFE